MPRTSRRRLLRDTVTVASLMGMPAMFDVLFLSASAAAAPPRRRGGSRDAGKAFAHPGILHSADDLKAIRERVKSGAEPWKTAWEHFKADKMLTEAAPKPVVHVIRGPYAKPDIGSTEIVHDSGAAYAHALLAAVTPDPAEAEANYRLAAAYLDAWSGTLRSIEGHDQKLLCGMIGYKFAAVAELLQFAGNVPRGVWSDKQHQAAKTMLTGVFLPPIRELFPEANGNWDAAMLQTMLAIAILTDDHPLFAHVVDEYYNSGGNGAITNYVWPSGQIEETSRDQGHVQMGIGALSTTCRIAWVQGVDLYSAADNRLALGFEYTAKYGLGEDVPSDGGVPGAGARGKFAPIYENVYQHYAVEKGLPMPYTRRVIELKRPEGYDGAYPSWGTLTACRTPELPPPPSGDILAAAQAAALPPKDPEREIAVPSPSGNLTATIGVRGGKLTYSLRDKAGQELLRPSTAGLTFGDGITALDGGLALWEVAASRREIDRPRLYGQNGDQDPALAPHLPFEQRILTLRENAAPHRILRAELRVYDAGIALRLTLPPNRDPATKAKTANERTEFAFPETSLFYASYESEDEFHPVAFRELKPDLWLPFTVRAGTKGSYLSVLEVDETTVGAPQTLLTPSPATPNAVVTNPRGPVAVLDEASTAFPWRVVLTGETPARLAENARLAISLWPRSVLPDGDVSWIRPGKAIRTALSTDAATGCIDFAAQNGLQYILFDSGWYGPENDEASDARVPHRGLDLPRVIAHGKEKGIGVLLYVGHKAVEKQVSEIVPLYEKWGVAGIKFGFMDVGPADKMQFLRDAAALCAQHHLLLDIHDFYRPIGVSGLYPNLLTQEGVRGNEHMPTPRHNCTLPFTRFLSGPADYTICYRFPKLKTTDAHQMALSVLYYSPLTLVYWYGKPEEYEGLPDREFFHGLPTIWDETVWLGGEIGEWAAVARRSGREWFVAAITNESARTIPLSFDFLPEGKSFTLHAYTDTPVSAPGAPITHGVSRIAITEQKHVRRGAPALQAALHAAGGIALRLTAD